MTLRPSIRGLLLGVNAFVLLVPLSVVVLLRIYETHLIQQTENRLIAESVLIGEAWRDRWLEEQGIPLDDDFRTTPVSARNSRFFPIEPVLDLASGLLPALTPPPTRFAERRDTPEWRAAERITPMLRRAQRLNLSGARLLDATGCVIASTSDNDLGTCIDHLPEVQAALAGRYSAVARERVSDEPPPPLASISRRGSVRVFVATPIVHEGKVIGVVRLARTGLDPMKSIWLHRRPWLVALALSLTLTLAVSLFLSYTITRPVRAITRAAQRIAAGDRRQPFAKEGIVPVEVQQLSAALDSMTEQLTDRATAIADFAATVSHEIKTPLTGIRGAAELLRDSFDEMSAEQRRRFIDNIDADAAHMQQLATRLLQLARIQSAPEADEPLEVAPFFTTLLGRYGDAVRLQLTGEPRVTLNPEHLASAVRNLVDNAVRHGGGKPVDVRVGAAGTRLQVVVQDYGAGISAANQARLFSKFFTTERDRGGTGLGLAIVKAIADKRGGEIRFTTGAVGTTFTLVL